MKEIMGEEKEFCVEAKREAWFSTVVRATSSDEAIAKAKKLDASEWDFDDYSGPREDYQVVPDGEW